MIIPVKWKHRCVFSYPKHASTVSNGTRRRTHRKGGEPDKFFCPCGGEIKMVTRFRRGFKTLAVCQKCGKERRKPNDF